MAYALAVYASQPGSPLNHARLASGWWPTLAGRASLLLEVRTGSHCEVSAYMLHDILLTQAFPGAPKRGSELVVLSFYG